MDRKQNKHGSEHFRPKLTIRAIAVLMTRFAKRLVILTVLGLLAACGGGSDGSAAASPLVPAPARTFLASTAAEPAGANCAAGGIRTQTGLDTNANGVLYAGEVNATSYACNKAWGTAALIETNNADSAYDPQIAFDAQGNALAIWSQRSGPGTFRNIWFTRYTAATGWGVPALVETNNVGHAGTPQIAIGANGNALAV